MIPHITQAKLKELLHYDPETGVFTWLVSRGLAKKGAEAGFQLPGSHVQIKILKRAYPAHRLAWLYVYGETPRRIVTKDGNWLNTSIENLRANGGNPGNMELSQDADCVEERLHPVNGRPVKNPVHITQVKLKEVLHYNPETGVFTWLKSTNPQRVKDGSTAGGPTQGYWNIAVFGKTYRAHRLAWLYVYGTLPARVDHKDGVGTHNWISNLRECTQKQNVANTRKKTNNTSGYKGVTKAVYGGWVARIRYKGKGVHLGHFDTPELAHEFYCLAADMIHGEFSNHGVHKCESQNT